MKNKLSILLSALLLCMCAAANATVKTYVASAPFTFATRGNWGQNALQGTESGTSVGNPSVDSTAFHIEPQVAGTVTVDARKVIASSTFNSWLGQANPTGDFASQNGNKLVLTLQIVDVTPFRFSELVLTIGSSNTAVIPNSVVRFDGSNFVGYPFAKGLSYGPDGIKGTADDAAYLTPLNASHDFQMNEFTLVDYGSASPVFVDASLRPGATQQAKLNDALASFNVPVTLTMTWSSTTGAFNPVSTHVVLSNLGVPEPSAMSMLLSFGLWGGFLYRKR